MGHRGVHFALSVEQEASLLGVVGDDDAVMDFVYELENEWDKTSLCETDKAWDAIHRCFCGGKLDYEGGDHPMNKMICGGRLLLEDEEPEDTVAYVSASIVREIAEAASQLSKEELRSMYGRIKQRGYQFRLGDEDFNYTWENFVDLREFYVRTAAQNRSVVFHVDC